MGQCACLKQSSRKPGSSTTLDEYPAQNKRKTSQQYENFQKQQEQCDPYYSKFQIYEHDFKEYSKEKSQEFYLLFFKFIVLSEQIGTLIEYKKRQLLYKGLTQVSVLKEKVENDFKIGFYDKNNQKRPITDEDILIYTIQNSQKIIDAIKILEEDPYYEELFPILSFSFMEIKNKFIAILNQLNQLKEVSQSKHQISIELIG